MICIIQARYSSKRFPGKVLKKLSGEIILKRVIKQVKKSKKINKIIVATSKHHTDSKIINFCLRNKIDFSIGPLHNVFKRFYLVLNNKNFPSFVRITADSPILDPNLIDRAINLFKINNLDIVTNVFPRTFPKGFSIEVVRSKLIIDNLIKIKKSKHKEHLTSFFYDNYKKFKIKNFLNKIDYSNINLSIDNRCDFVRVNKILKYNKKQSIDLNRAVFLYNKLFYEKKT